jgi:SMODS and SLOG-associating 2TM effector domain family 4
MFQITLAEHVRLSFGSALAAYEGHAEAAAKLSRRSSHARLALLGLSGLAAIVSAIAAYGESGWQITAGILTAAVFAACATYVGMNQQLLVYGHRVSAAKLWVLCEKYRGLLAEMQDDLIDPASLQNRRSALLSEYAAVIEQSAPDDRYTYEIARAALSGPGKDVYFAALHASGNGAGVDRASSDSHAAGAPNR